ncbi:transposase [Sporocytophaga myxococcoides]|uniref:transposase n=1 Tax=Sporocytophaga myxococcoides TaxID=153721 RepID=UPI00040A8C0E|nr:transposase [Sporocytophaga myxococcoides]
MENPFLKTIRNSRMNLKEVYYWTNTIKDCRHLLKEDKFKLIILEELKWLVDHKKIVVYAFVIMPNHMHLVWELLEFNGKESPHASFNKWTSSQFLKNLRKDHPKVLPFFVEQTSERSHRFWQRDPLAVLMNSRKKVEQKIDYIHLNPLNDRWNLVKSPEDYKWSSANFYEKGLDEFRILTHYMDRF